MRRMIWIVVLLALGTSMSAWAKPGTGNGPRLGHGWGPGGPDGPGFGLCRALGDPALGVTEEQASRLKPLCRAHRDKVSSIFDAMEDLHEALRAELDRDAPDFDRVGSLHQQLATLHTELARRAVALRTEAKGIFSAEQDVKLRAMRDERARRRGRSGHQGGPGDGDGRGPAPEDDDPEAN